MFFLPGRSSQSYGLSSGQKGRALPEAPCMLQVSKKRKIAFILLWGSIALPALGLIIHYSVSGTESAQPLLIYGIIMIFLTIALKIFVSPFTILFSNRQGKIKFRNPEYRELFEKINPTVIPDLPRQRRYAHPFLLKLARGGLFTGLFGVYMSKGSNIEMLLGGIILAAASLIFLVLFSKEKE